MATDPILQLAAQFVPDPPPPTYEARLEYLWWSIEQAEFFIDLLPEPENYDVGTVLSDMTSVRKLVERAAASWVPGTKIIQGIKMTGEVVCNFLIGAFVAATTGADVHTPMMRAAVLSKGIMTPAELNADYYRRIGVLQAIVAIGKSGVLDPVFEAEAKRREAAGTGLALGALPIWAVIVIIVAVVAVIAALAYAVVQIFSIQQTNKLIDKYVERLCFDAQGNPIPAVQGECVKLLSDLDKNRAVSTGTKPLLDQVVMYAAIGVGVYALVTFLPDIVRSVKEARAVARES